MGVIYGDNTLHQCSSHIFNVQKYDAYQQKYYGHNYNLANYLIMSSS